MNKLVKVVTKKDLIKEFLVALNGILKLTDREIDVLSIMVELTITYSNIPDIANDIVSTDNRKYIIHNTNVTKDNLSRYIKSFKEKGILFKDNMRNIWNVNTALIPEIINDRIQITIVIKINN